MFVDELISLQDWVQKYVATKKSSYKQIQSVLEHNSNQQNKQEVEPSFLEIIEALKSQPTEQLTEEQRVFLKNIEAFQYIGAAGVKWYEETIKRTEYDPATSARLTREAFESINNLISNLSQIVSALDATKYKISEVDDIAGQVIGRIHFEGDAKIDNMVDFEKWAKDWNLIARSLAEAVKERPEDVKIVGASTGSVILWIGGSLLVMRLLAILANE